MMSADGRVVMISGANRGIGAAIVRRLRAAGFRLSLGVRDTVLTEVGEPARCLVTHYEARERDAAKAWVAATVERYGRIDALIKHAGISREAPIEDENEEALDDLWLVNVKAPLRLVRAALPYLKQSGVGRVVNVASLSGLLRQTRSQREQRLCDEQVCARRADAFSAKTGMGARHPRHGVVPRLCRDRHVG